MEDKGKELTGKPLYNQTIDEVYELEEAEDVYKEEKIENNIVDRCIEVSQSSQDSIPTPKEGSEIDSNDERNDKLQGDLENMPSNNLSIDGAK